MTKVKNVLLPVYVLLALNLGACATNSPSQAMQERVKIAKAKFDEHCKSAGEKVYRTVDGVEGVFLMKLRPEKINFGNQFAMDDPYGRDLGGEGYLQSFLRAFYPADKSKWISGSPPRNGYGYVEAFDPKDGQLYRYTGEWKKVLVTSSVLQGGDGKTQFYTDRFVLEGVPVPGMSVRYGVTYDDISTHEDREYWIAGSSLRVVDLQTNEVIAERIGYMWDPGQGNSSGGRSPWLLAANYACPSFQRNPNLPLAPGHGASAQQIQTEDFVEKILIPKLHK